MAELHSLVFTKKMTGASFDSAEHGVVCLEDMPLIAFEAKDVAENDWPDEHGLDVYENAESSIKFKPQDITFVMGSKGDGWLSQYNEFLTFLTTGGLQMIVASRYTEMTIQSARFVKAEPGEYFDNGNEKVFTFKLTLKITGY